MSGSITFGELNRDLYQKLVSAGIDRHEARREVELIVEHASGKSTAKQLLAEMESVSESVLSQVELIMEQRLKRVPLQYCLGHTYFMGFRFAVRPGVLIPRADTETLVELALRLIEPKKDPIVLDVGTGSGAIPISMACLRLDLRAVAIDISAEALEIADENAQVLGVADRVALAEADWFSLAASFSFDAVLSNPPYVPASLSMELQPEVGVFEPKQAVFGLGDDGLDFFRSLSKRAGQYLRDDGFIAVEVGKGQADAVRHIFESDSWKDVQTHNDLNKIARVVSAFRPF